MCNLGSWWEMWNGVSFSLEVSGHASHGVHLCHKCGWPFPNPHPSAKHRRAHKKVCGTIEGYKLTESEATHLAISDDEHPSDDDRRTPSNISLFAFLNRLNGLFIFVLFVCFCFFWVVWFYFCFWCWWIGFFKVLRLTPKVWKSLLLVSNPLDQRMRFSLMPCQSFLIVALIIQSWMKVWRLLKNWGSMLKTFRGMMTYPRLMQLPVSIYWYQLLCFAYEINCKHLLISSIMLCIWDQLPSRDFSFNSIIGNVGYRYWISDNIILQSNLLLI